MANEIHIDYESDSTLCAVVRNNAGQVWYVSGASFEDWGSGGHDASDYAIALTDKDGGRYVGSFDSNISAGRYTIQVFAQAGASPADDDALVGSGSIIWTGSAELTTDKILANKAIQNKVSGEIDYYDDDGETIILTHTPADLESTIARTPG